MIKPVTYVPITNESIDSVVDYIFAPWVKSMGLTEFTASYGLASAILPQSDKLQWANGAICGQALMAAIDTVIALAIHTGERPSKGTASQSTQFLQRAAGDDLKIVAEVLKFGSTIAYAEARVTFLGSGELVAHSTAEFVY